MSPETCRAELKRLIKEKLLHLFGYLHRCTKMMHGHTNIEFKFLSLKYFRTAVTKIQQKLSFKVGKNCV